MCTVQRPGLDWPGGCEDVVASWSSVKSLPVSQQGPSRPATLSSAFESLYLTSKHVKVEPTRQTHNTIIYHKAEQKLTQD